MKKSSYSSLWVMALSAALVVSNGYAADRKFRIAFVDTGNTGRSVTSEVLAKQEIDKQGLNIEVISRAISLNPYNITPEENFITLLGERNIKVPSRTAVQFGIPEARYTDLVLTMTASHKNWLVNNFPEIQCKVFTLSEYASGTNQEILDAYAQPMDFYKKVLAQLEPLVVAVIKKAKSEKLYENNKIGQSPACPR
jgi:protein-tyrosine phosphatase